MMSFFARLCQAFTIGLFTLSQAMGATVELTDVRVLSGSNGHARIVIQTTGAIGNLQTSSSPPVGAVPARANLLLPNVKLSQSTPSQLTIASNGVLRVNFIPIGDDIQLTVDLTGARSASAAPLGTHGIVFDLIEEGRAGDPTLPGDETIQEWTDGLVEAIHWSPSESNRQFLVVIDPGHGGKDSGAIGISGVRESDIAMQISLRTAIVLERNPNISIVLTRNDDRFVSLRDRSRSANNASADLFLSIHANAAESSDLWGVETYSLNTSSDAGATRVAARENRVAQEYRKEKVDSNRILASLEVAGTNRLSAQLAGEVQHQTIHRLNLEYQEHQVNDLGAKTALFYVLTTTRMPAILFEAGFLSNPQDERRLRSPYYQQAMAEALADAVETWLAAQ